jgi:hypothetical protein
MATVSSIVVRRRLASMRQVEEALARQTLYGGDVVTNLLEVAPPPATDEAALTAALAESLDVPPASVSALRAPDPAVVARVSRNIAEEHGFVPIAIRDGSIVVALAEPLGEAALLDLRAMLGADIVQEAAPFVRLRQALERAYGVPMDRRTRRLAAILDGTNEVHPGPARQRSVIPDLPDDPVLAARSVPPPPVTPTPALAAPSRPPPATTIRTPAAGADALKWFVKSARGDAPPEERRESAPRFSIPGGRRRRGPFTREDVDKVFVEPASTDAVLGAVLEFAQQWFAYVALFLVHEDLAEGWEASGPGAAGDRVRKMGVPLDLPSMFMSARDTRGPLVQPRPRDGLDVVIAQDLERPIEGDALVAPVVVGKRVVALLYADDAGDAMSTVDTAQVLAVVANAGAALARMILKKKGKAPAASRAFTPPPPALPRSLDTETRVERAGALAQALKRASQRPQMDEGQPAPKHTPITGDRVRAASLDALRAEQSFEPIAAPIEAPSEASWTSPPRKQTLTGMPQSVPPPDSSPDAPTGLPLSGSGEIPALRDLERPQEAPAMSLPEHVEDGAEEPPTPVIQPRSAPKGFQPAGASAQPPPPALMGRRALGPVIPREEPGEESSRPVDRSSEPQMIETAQVTDDELEELLELADRSNVVDFDDHGRPSERFESYQPREPPRPLGRASEHELPKVIVAIEPEYVGLVGRVIRGGQGGEAASAELRRLGVAALPAIMDRFPGPTRVDRTTSIAQVPRPSDAGPLLSLLVALGRLAHRDILARTGDPLPETRFWATWLLTEIVDTDSAAPLVPRLVDDDLAVRRAAWAAGRTLLLADRRTAEVLLEPLVGVILDPGGGVSLRIRSAQALGELRDRRAVEGLIFGLDAREPEIAAACHEALVTITRHDPPRRGESWPSWFSQYGTRSRIEWLMNALLDEELGNREIAASELKELTKVFFGYYANLPRKEREDAHRRYLTWWREEGQRKFEGRL